MELVIFNRSSRSFFYLVDEIPLKYFNAYISPEDCYINQNLQKFADILQIWYQKILTAKN